MNIIQGKIVSVNVNGELSLVKLKAGEIKLTTIVIDTPQTSSYLRPNHSVKVIFKENEVIIANAINCSISLQNKFYGEIISIESDKLLSKLVIKTSVGNITSIITTNAVNQLDLQLGKMVTAMIKTNELMLSE